MKDKKKGLLHLFIIIAIIGLCSYITLVGITSAHKGSAKNIKLGLTSLVVGIRSHKDIQRQLRQKDTIQMSAKQSVAEKLAGTRVFVVQVGDNRIEIDIPGAAMQMRFLNQW